MPLWKALLSYDGTHYNGWQVQPGLPTVQGRLSDAIHHVTSERVLPQGSGRTDAGVHALGQVASFALAAPIPAVNLQRALNRALPPSIRILSITAAADGFHARHSAVRKTYQYRIFPRLRGADESICPPMLAPYVWDCPWQTDLAVMRCAAMDIVGEHDFTSFAASDPDLATRANAEQAPPNPIGRADNVRRIDTSAWTERDGFYLYTVTGSGFLHHMVRNLVGTFVDIGAGRLPANCIPALIRDRDRSKAGPTAPARGLFLIDVEY
jgi:tRNA pseudouridine38-40 synthase